ncbi:MAG: cobyric acid synthase [Blautia sp.]|nr:cobyric acid synthase [Blautia sp.]
MALRIMIQGTMSGAGKSLLTAALCRIFRQDGLRAAPFKSQNMALNSAITLDGAEIGRAQAIQAQAAGIEPDARMNPILLKPTGDMSSQLIVGGRVRGNYNARDYFRMKKSLIPEILSAYESLSSEFDVIVIEGAGSPAEINLKENDIVNMGLAEMVDAPVLLAGDIDRGGVFAQLYGTVALLEDHEKTRIGGLIINKFRGDPEILKPGLSMLEEKTGIPVLGVVPYINVRIDDEDSLSERLQASHPHREIDIAVIRFPRISNFTDFDPLEQHPSLGVRYVTRPDQLLSPDLIILPGSKNTMDDLLWMRQNGLEASIKKLASSGTPILGICGGYQMLGRCLKDPYHTEHGGELRGMELLPCETTFSPQKTRTRVKAIIKEGPFAGSSLEAYEIHMGLTSRTGGQPFAYVDSRIGGKTSVYVNNRMEDQPPAYVDSHMEDQPPAYVNNRMEDQPPAYVDNHMGDQPPAYVDNRMEYQTSAYVDNHTDGTVCGNIIGTYLHGLFDTGELTESIARWLLNRKGLPVSDFRPRSHEHFLAEQFDILAESVRASLNMEAIYRIMGRSRPD